MKKMWINPVDMLEKLAQALKYKHFGAWSYPHG
jgi:hypothetical protein